MLQTAHEAVARIMALARRLGGVISGEHGIGITKLEFLSDEELKSFADYKARIDPEGRFNKGKLLRRRSAGNHPSDLSAAYTPSFGLMGHESLIMQRSRNWRHQRQHQRLPALRQMQAGLCHPCAARQFAVQPA